MEKVRIELNGEVVVCAREDWEKTADELFNRHPNAGAPKVELVPVEVPGALTDRVTLPTKAVSMPTTATMAVDYPNGASQDFAVVSTAIRGKTVDTEGALRSSADLLALEAAGFAPKQPLFTRGTMVVDLGVENARRSRIEHDAKPSPKTACTDLIHTVKAEDRDDIIVAYSDLRMDRQGLIVIRGDQRLPIGEEAFTSFVNRLGCGGSQYLVDSCWPDLRARNINNQLMARAGTREVVLRTRHNAKEGGREIFGVVTPRYTPFDVDMVAEAIKIAAPEDARCTVDYDGTKARFEVVFHSNIQPEKYVAGEFFKAGVVISAGDTGGNSIKGSSVVWQNLCLNLIIIDQTTKPIFALRHMGSVGELARELKRGFSNCLKNIDHFLKAWGYAQEENVVVSVKEFFGADITENAAMEGIFRGLIERDMVPLKKSEDTVSKLMNAWHRDQSAAQGTNRAAVVNAITRYAHEELNDAWEQDELQRAAGQLLYGKGNRAPAKLPFSQLGE